MYAEKEQITYFNAREQANITIGAKKSGTDSASQEILPMIKSLG